LPFGVQLTTRTLERLDTLNDRIGHGVDITPSGSVMSSPGGTLAARADVDSKTAMKANRPAAATASHPHLVPPVLLSDGAFARRQHRAGRQNPPDFSMSRTMNDTVLMPTRLLKRFVETLSIAA
jgi:hypothetical protein